MEHQSSDLDRSCVRANQRGTPMADNNKRDDWDETFWYSGKLTRRRLVGWSTKAPIWIAAAFERTREGHQWPTTTNVTIGTRRSGTAASSRGAAWSDGAPKLRSGSQLRSSEPERDTNGRQQQT